MGSHLGTYRKASTTNLSYSRGEAQEFHRQLAALIQKTELERKIALDGLQPLFQDWQTAKARDYFPSIVRRLTTLCMPCML